MPSSSALKVIWTDSLKRYGTAFAVPFYLTQFTADAILKVNKKETESYYG